MNLSTTDKRLNGMRGIEILRCGAQTPMSAFADRKSDIGFFLHAGGDWRFAPQRRISIPRFCRLRSRYSAACPVALRCAEDSLKRRQRHRRGADSAVGGRLVHAETNLGDLVADAVRQTGSAQVALIPSDEIDGGASIPAGKTEASKIVSALHYAGDPSDTVVVLTLTGAQLFKVAERSVSRAPEPFDGFLQVSGLQIRYDAGQPEGKRVSLVGVGGSEVDSGKAYRVAMTRCLGRRQLGLLPDLDHEKYQRRYRRPAV